MQSVKLVKVTDLKAGDVLADHGKTNKTILALVDSGAARWAHFAGGAVRLDAEDVRSVVDAPPAPRSNYAAERAALNFAAHAAYVTALNSPHTPEPTPEELIALLTALQARLCDSPLMLFLSFNFEDLSDAVHVARAGLEADAEADC
jgi:hypothetical protein